ncbi:putative pilus system protein FilF [Acinetobacter rudis]|uniref:putative pilus system protein FilF n=1 Tax=Acinetobacter rudis TaxID=632955 RepID=UPI00333E7DD1
MNVKIKKVVPSVLSLGILSLLSACGGDSASINERPEPELVNYTNGCYDTDQRCQNFVIDYPVAGLDFDCQKDTVNHFETALDKNVALGGCRAGDTVKFTLQSTANQPKIILGDIDLSKLNPRYALGQPTQISLMHIAAAMTGKDLVKTEQSDETFRVLVALIRMFQALGVEQGANQIGDIQPITLDAEHKKKLADLTASVGVKDFLDGSYVSKLQPWVNISQISEAQAEASALELMNLTKVNIYSANMVPFIIGSIDVRGFHGKSETNPNKEALANLYLLNTRDGHTLGYTVLWAGTPKVPEGVTEEQFKRILLISQFAPEKLSATAQQGWVNTFSNKITQPLRFTQSNRPDNYLQINQGQFFNNNTVPGNEYVYKRATGDSKPPQDPKVYGAWDQVLNGERFKGQIDIFKSNPATYLDKRVFKSEAKVKSGEDYIFPLYATLSFSFDDDKRRPPVKVGIVIDENGDIRSNRTANELYSEQCPSINTSTYIDDYGVQQYRIGTTGAANYALTDKSLTLRMILADPIFAPLDGAIMGLNETFILSPNNNSSRSNTYNNTAATRESNDGKNSIGFTSGGLRINLQNLLVNPDVSRGINIHGWGQNGSTEATWGNMYATMQLVYNNNNKDQVTEAQKELVKNMGGGLSINLASCYQIKKKR